MYNRHRESSDPKGFTENNPKLAQALKELEEAGFKISLKETQSGIIEEIGMVKKVEGITYAFTFTMPIAGKSSAIGSFQWDKVPPGWDNVKCPILHDALVALNPFNRMQPDKCTPPENWAPFYNEPPIPHEEWEARKAEQTAQQERQPKAIFGAI